MTSMLQRLLAVLACLIGLAGPARAQTFVELGGGWNYLGTAQPSTGAQFNHSFNLRASVGDRLAQHVRLRFDLADIQFDERQQFYPPCGPPGCSGTFYTTRPDGVLALTANALVDVDTRGIFYLTGGSGIYDAQVPASEFHVGVSAGAGAAIPISGHWHAIVEARIHRMLGSTAGPPWVLPVTVGFRY